MIVVNPNGACGTGEQRRRGRAVYGLRIISISKQVTKLPRNTFSHSWYPGIWYQIFYIVWGLFSVSQHAWFTLIYHDLEEIKKKTFFKNDFKKGLPIKIFLKFVQIFASNNTFSNQIATSIYSYVNQWFECNAFIMLYVTR